MVSGKSGAAFDRFQGLQPFAQAWTAEGLARGAIRLVKGRFEDQRHFQTVGHLPKRLRDLQRQVVRLDHARPGDPEQRLAGATDELINGNGQGGGHGIPSVDEHRFSGNFAGERLEHSRFFGVVAKHFNYFFNSTGTWSIFAARMKSFSDNPPMACVQISMATLR